MSGVSIICFASSYAIALGIEALRPWLPNRARSVAFFGFLGAGMVAHSAFLFERAAEAVASPLSSEMDWYLVAAWVLAAVCLCSAALYPKIPFGLFLLPLSLALIGVAGFWANREGMAAAPASKVWGAIHGLSILLAAVSVLIGAAAALMYFIHTRQLKRKRLPELGLRLPSLEWLQRANSHAIVLAVFLLTIGVVSGMVLNRIVGAAATGRARLPWHDPIVVSTLLLLVWLAAAIGVGIFYRPVLQGRKIALLTFISFILLAIVLLAGLRPTSRHWDRDVQHNRPTIRAGNPALCEAPRVGGRLC